MFGKNPTRPRSTDPNALHVEDIFPTIQGEGPFSGQCATFIRLAGCNLACTFCDTQFEEGMQRPPASVLAIIEKVKAFHPQFQKLVVLTGGEPLRQDLSLLIPSLVDIGVEKIQIETAGVLWQSFLEAWVHCGTVHVVCSPKTLRVHEDLAAFCRDWKYVVSSYDQHVSDGLPWISTQGGQIALAGNRIWRREGGWLPGDRIWVSPKDEYDKTQNRLNVEAVRDLAMRYGYRVSLQVHKILGVA